MENTDLSKTKGGEKKSVIAAPKPGPSMAILEEKMDQILKYQKTVRRLAIFRGIISFIFFIVFIVLPIVGSFYLFQFLKSSDVLDKVSGQYKEFYETLDELKETSDQVGSFKNLLNVGN